jgi:hypothetical protein
LCLSALLPWAADVAFTLAGQPATYWAGEYATAREANPLAAWWLEVHPLAFVLGACLWAGMFSAFLLVRGSRPPALLVALSHGVGGSSWLVGVGRLGYVVPVLYLVLVERFVSWCHGGVEAERRSFP